MILLNSFYSFHSLRWTIFHISTSQVLICFLQKCGKKKCNHPQRMKTIEKANNIEQWKIILPPKSFSLENRPKRLNGVLFNLFWWVPSGWIGWDQWPRRECLRWRRTVGLLRRWGGGSTISTGCAEEHGMEMGHSGSVGGGGRRDRRLWKGEGQGMLSQCSSDSPFLCLIWRFWVCLEMEGDPNCLFYMGKGSPSNFKKGGEKAEVGHAPPARGKWGPPLKWWFPPMQPFGCGAQCDLLFVHQWRNDGTAGLLIPSPFRGSPRI